jgi:hypothetical protein|tara:strand:- start:42 stop:632 length:591 start_codon:yes stop_codon:yes gene_type:complete
MPISLNGSGTITGVSVGGLPDGVVDTDTLAAKAAAAAKLGDGSVVQVKHVIKTDTFTTSSASWNDIPSLNTSITMTSSSNKVLVLVNLCILNDSTTGSTSAIQRTTSGSSSFIGIATSGYGSRQNGGSAELYEPRQDTSKSVSYTVEDTPGAGTHTYTVMVDPNSYTLCVNRSASDSDAADFVRGTSSLIVMEVVA